jgi:hypothetical protein
MHDDDPSPDDADFVVSAIEQTAASKKRAKGRPTKYRPEFVQVARQMCSMGATDYDLSQAFGVNIDTLYQWRAVHPEFSEALKVHKGEFDERIMRSLAMRASGYSYQTEKIHVSRDGKVTRIPTVEHVPPDVSAAIKWLYARKPEQWAQPEVKRLEVTGADGAPLLDDVSLARRMLAILAAAQDDGRTIDVEATPVPKLPARINGHDSGKA